MESELELGDDTEITAAAGDRPKQVLIFRRARAHLTAVRKEDLGGEQIVGGKAPSPAQPAEASSEGEPGNPGMGHYSSRRSQSMRLSSGIEITPQSARLDPRHLRFRINLHPTQGRKVDHDAVVAQRRPRDIVASATNRDWQTLLAGKGQSASRVGATGALGDERRPTIDGAVPNSPGGIIVGVPGFDQATSEPGQPRRRKHAASFVQRGPHCKDKNSTCISIRPCHTEGVAEYNQYCAIARGAEIFAERWTPLIVRNIMLGCHSFNAIADGVPKMSRTLLTRRLRELSRLGVIDLRPNPGGRGHLYFLTPAGQELKEVTMALGTWGARWIELAPADYDAGVVLWAICRLASAEALPRQRRTVRFELTGRKRERYWVVFQRPEAEVCLKPPGFDEDLVVTTTAEWLTKWHAGLISWEAALRQGLIHLEGTPSVAQALPKWAPLSAFARIRPVAAAT